MIQRQIKSTAPQSGFTLVELILVLSVVAILLGVAAPSFFNIIANNKVVTASNDLVTALNLAKSEAVRSGHNAVMCKSVDSNQCNDDSSWSSGWLLFQDLDDDRIMDDDEAIIRVQTNIDQDLNFVFAGVNNSITFSPNGRINANGRFCFNNSYKPENSRAVIITQSGRIRTEVRNSADNCASA